MLPKRVHLLVKYTNPSQSQSQFVSDGRSVSQSVSLGFEPLAGTHGHIFAFERMLWCYLSWGAHPDGWTGLSCRESQSLSVSFLFLFLMF
jgi:hypothetical protein